MGKLQFIQESVNHLDKLYRLAETKVEPEQETESKSTKKTSKKADVNSSATPSKTPPPVIPLTQSEILEDGSLVNKRVKPLTYALMSWVKNDMGLPDTIDISDDEDYGQFEVSIPDLNEEFEYKCYFNTNEIHGLIAFYIYYFDEPIAATDSAKVKEFIFQKNMECLTGQIQLVDNSDSTQVIRYYSGIFVNGIASDDPDYSGEFQISPKLYKNMFEQGFECMNNFIPELKEFLSS